MKPPRFTPILTAVLFAALLGAPAAFGQQMARSPAEAPPEQATWERTIGAQLVVLLEEQNTPAMKDHVMTLIVDLSGRRDVMPDFDAVVPKLFDIYRNDGSESRRLSALQALGATESPLAMKALAGHVQQEGSLRVREQTIAVLADYIQSRDAS